MMHFHSYFFYAHAKWKARINCDSWTSARIEVLGREGLVSLMCGCTLCLGLPYKNSSLRRCSTRQPTVYSYTASHRSPCLGQVHQHVNTSINMITTIPTHIKVTSL